MMVFNTQNKLLAGVGAAHAINGRSPHDELFSGRRDTLESRGMNNRIMMRPLKNVTNQ
jgi:hypothetical protein